MDSVFARWVRLSSGFGLTEDRFFGFRLFACKVSTCAAVLAEPRVRLLSLEIIRNFFHLLGDIDRTEGQVSVLRY